MDCFVYVLGSQARPKSKSQAKTNSKTRAKIKAGPRTYVGWTTDLDRRLAEHNGGGSGSGGNRGARSTRGRRWRLLYAERWAGKSEAMRREWYLKRDRAFRKRLVESQV